jgi:hypothetical protein
LAQQLESRPVRRTRVLLRAHRSEIIEACQQDNWNTSVDDIIQQASNGESNLSAVRDDFAILEYAALLALHGMVPPTLGTAYLLPIVVNSWSDVRPIVEAQRALSEVMCICSIMRHCTNSRSPESLRIGVLSIEQFAPFESGR